MSLGVQAWRAAYKLAWLARKGVRLAPWPHLNGALAAVWVQDRVLIVRNSYNSYHTLPGGRLNRGESYRDAAIRELAEETGIVAKPTGARPVHSEYIRRPFTKDRVEIFRVDLPEMPTVQRDPVEIAETAWLTREEALSLPLFSPTQRYLEKEADTSSTSV